MDGKNFDRGRFLKFEKLKLKEFIFRLFLVFFHLLILKNYQRFFKEEPWFFAEGSFFHGVNTFLYKTKLSKI